MVKDTGSLGKKVCLNSIKSKVSGSVRYLLQDSYCFILEVAVTVTDLVEQLDSVIIFIQLQVTEAGEPFCSLDVQVLFVLHYEGKWFKSCPVLP